MEYRCYCTRMRTVKHSPMKFIVAGNVRKLRTGLGKSIQGAAESVDMSRSYWMEVEKGEKDPSTATLERMAKALGVTVGELVAVSSK